MLQSRLTFALFAGIAVFSAVRVWAQPVAKMVLKEDVKIPYRFYSETDLGSFSVSSRGSLIAFERNDTSGPVIHSFDKDGHETPVVFSISGASKVHIAQAALGADGSLAVAGSASDQDGHRSGFISWITPDRQNSTTIRLSGYYHPQLVALAPDGTIWVEGWESIDSGGYQISKTAPVMRHYDRTGKMIGTALPSKDFSKDERFMLTGGFGFMETSSDRIGWIVGDNAYYEFSYDGTNVTEFPRVPLNKHGASQLIGLAMTDGGQVFAQLSVYAPGPGYGTHLYHLDRGGNQWIEMTEKSPGRLVPSSNGNSLVFWLQPENVHRLFSVE